MIIGIGTDIVEIKRIKDSIVEHVLTKEEKEIYHSKNGKKIIQYLAGRFAAKEAIIKAISQYENPHMLEIKIYNDTNGKPIVKYKNYKIMLSISHEDNYAIAFAIIEKR